MPTKYPVRSSCSCSLLFSCITTGFFFFLFLFDRAGKGDFLDFQLVVPLLDEALLQVSLVSSSDGEVHPNLLFRTPCESPPNNFPISQKSFFFRVCVCVFLKVARSRSFSR